MTNQGDSDLDLLLDAWMAPVPTAIPERLVAAVAEDIARLPQRRWKGAVRRLLGSAWTRTRFATFAAAAIVVLTAVAGASVLVRLPGTTLEGRSPVGATTSPTAPPVALELRVSGFAFEPSDLYAPANLALSIRLINGEAGVPVALAILDPAGATVFAGTVVSGVDEETLAVPGLAAGRYVLMDQVHPNTTAVLHVGVTGPPATSGPIVEPTPRPSVAVTIDVSVTATGFAPVALMMPARQRFFIRLDNRDNGVRHGIEILDGSGHVMLAAGSVTGPGSFTYPVDAMPAGTYTLIDPGHPSIQGTLVLGGG